MHKNRNFIQSFKYALTGFFFAFTYERNLRFHIWATMMILVFAYHFGLERLEWGILVIAIAFVIVCELVNTAIENAVDTATRHYSPTAKIAKDVAAGAVLLSAVTAVITGFVLFFDIERIIYTLHIIFFEPVNLAVFTAVFAMGGVFVLFGGRKRRRRK